MDHPVSKQQVWRSTVAVRQAIVEGRLSDAVSLLYFMHKNHIEEWVCVKRELLASAQDSKSLLTVATVLDASKRNTLSESARIIPGLCDLLHQDPQEELLD
jgi:hypothetical protein